MSFYYLVTSQSGKYTRTAIFYLVALTVQVISMGVYGLYKFRFKFRSILTYQLVASTGHLNRQTDRQTQGT